MERADVIVVGAGAAGLMAALTAAERGARVRLIDSQAKIGAKILVSGGGRCNVTNEVIDPSRYHGGSRTFVDRVLRAFSLDDTLRFFESVGVPLKLEPEMGKYFPVSDSARTVLDALLHTMRAAGVDLRTGLPVSDIQAGDGWTVQTPNGPHGAKAVILCTGGLSLPKSGSNGAGYGFASRLGHHVVQTTPALSPLLASPPIHADLSGITLPVRLTLREGGKILAAYEGSFLFTHVGYSGPAALNLSRHVARGRWEHPDAGVYMNLLPGIPEDGIGRFWDSLVQRHPKRGLGNTLAEFLPRRVAESVCARSSIAPTIPIGQIPARGRTWVLRNVFDQSLPVASVAGYTKAEATAGGVSLEEVEPATMMSRLRPGLFFAGEVLDVDGWLGGYNFQWAWSSGTVAGRAAARWAKRAT